MKLFLHKRSEWIPAKRVPRYEGIYLVRCTENSELYAEFRNGEWAGTEALVVAHWCGQDTRLEGKQVLRLKKILQSYHRNRDESQAAGLAALAALRLARCYAGPHANYPKGRRLKACKFFRVAERLDAPLESSDLEYLRIRWERLTEKQRRLIAGRVSKFVGGLGALEAKSPNAGRVK